MQSLKHSVIIKKNEWEEKKESDDKKNQQYKHIRMKIRINENVVQQTHFHRLLIIESIFVVFAKSILMNFFKIKIDMFLITNKKTNNTHTHTLSLHQKRKSIHTPKHKAFHISQSIEYIYLIYVQIVLFQLNDTKNKRVKYILCVREWTKQKKTIIELKMKRWKYSLCMFCK